MTNCATALIAETPIIRREKYSTFASDKFWTAVTASPKNIGTSNLNIAEIAPIADTTTMYFLSFFRYCAAKVRGRKTERNLFALILCSP